MESNHPTQSQLRQVPFPNKLTLENEPVQPKYKHGQTKKQPGLNNEAQYAENQEQQKQYSLDNVPLSKPVDPDTQ